MSEWNTEQLIAWGKRFVRLPYTDMREWCAAEHEPLVLVEGPNRPNVCERTKGVIPDMTVLGKGVIGRYLPLVITLISEKLFSAFNGSVAEARALAWGHSYTGNALGCAAAKASLEVFEKEGVLEALQPKIRNLSSIVGGFRELPGVKEMRQRGFIAGIEMQEPLETARPSLAAAVCVEARRHGLLTSPIWNVVVLMPLLCTTIAQLTKAVEALRSSIIKVSSCSTASAKKDAEEVTA